MDTPIRSLRTCAFTLLICAAVFSWERGVFAEEEEQDKDTPQYKVTLNVCEEWKWGCMTAKTGKFCDYAIDPDDSDCIKPVWCEEILTNAQFCISPNISTKCCAKEGFCEPYGAGASECVPSKTFAGDGPKQCKNSTGKVTGYWRCTKTDDDSDGWSADVDCNDENDQIYPDAYDTNPQCGTELEWSVPAGDYNCNEVDDFDERNNVCSNSPIVLDLAGDGFALTSAEDGVRFDLNRDGRHEQLPWTHPRGNEAWLALDRNGNGQIDNGGELFGNYTAQPVKTDRNGFEALAVYDTRAQGGDENGWIDADDRVFVSLRAWRDANHNGRSETAELLTLPAAGISRLALSYRETLRVDQFGNWFRFAAQVVGQRPSDIGETGVRCVPRLSCGQVAARAYGAALREE